MIELKYKFDDTLLQESLNYILTFTDFCKHNQIGLTHSKYSEDVWHDACGSLVQKLDNGQTIKDENKKLIYIKNEKDFVIKNSKLKNSYFDHVITTLEKKFIFTRIRIIKLKHKSCLSWHLDDNNRLHIPIKTQEGCFFIQKNDKKTEVYEMLNQGSVYFVETSKHKHTAVNASPFERIHLVFNLREKK